MHRSGRTLKYTHSFSLWPATLTAVQMLAEERSHSLSRVVEDAVLGEVERMAEERKGSWKSMRARLLALREGKCSQQ